MWRWRVGIGVVFVYAILITVYAFHWHPLPIPDWGHRVFSVPDKHAAQVVVGMLEEVSDLREWFTFDAGPTHQTLLSDGETVIMWVDEELHADGKLGPNGFSVVTSDPGLCANTAARFLTRRGFKAMIKSDLMPEFDKKLVAVKSSAFNAWSLVCRLHSISMGKPKTYKLLE